MSHVLRMSILTINATPKNITKYNKIETDNCIKRVTPFANGSTSFSILYELDEKAKKQLL